MRYPGQVSRHPGKSPDIVECIAGAVKLECIPINVYTEYMAVVVAISSFPTGLELSWRRLVELIGVAWSRMAVACFCASMVIFLGRNLDFSQQSATPDVFVEWLSSKHLSWPTLTLTKM